MTVENNVVCFTKMNVFLLGDIEKCSVVKWAYGGIDPSKLYPRFKFAKLVLWSNGQLTYFSDLHVIREEWDEVEPEEFLERCKTLLPIKEKDDENRS